MGKKENRQKSRSRTTSCSSEDELTQEQLQKMYLDLKSKLLQDKSLMIAGADAYGSFYSLDGQQINPSEPVLFKYSQAAKNIDLVESGQSIIPRRDGLYFITLHLTPDGASQWTLFVNNFPQYDRIFGTYNSSGQITITYLIALKANDIVTIRNYESVSSVVAIPQIVGGYDLGANAEIVFEKIAPYPEEPVKCLLSKKDEDCDSDKLNKKDLCLQKQFATLKKWMKCDPSLMINGCTCYGSFYSTMEQDVAVDAPVLFEKNQNVQRMVHVLGSGDIKVLRAGVYVFVFIAQTSQACQFTLFINGVAEQTTTTGINKGANVIQLHQEIQLNAGDIVSIRNHVSATGTIRLIKNSGGVLTGVNTELILYRISPPMLLLSDNDVFEPCQLERDSLYRKFKEYLLKDDCLTLRGSKAHTLVSSTLLQTLNLEDTVDFNLRGPTKNVFYKTGTDSVTILEDGVYKINFDLQARQPSQFTVYVNNIPNDSTIAGTDSGSGQVSIRQLLQLHKGDVITVKNHSSFLNPVLTTMNPGGKKPGINVVFILKKLASIPKPKKCLPSQPPK